MDEMTRFDPLIFAALILPVTYLSIFIHELGHALMGRTVGFVVNSFGIGTGRPFLVFTVRAMRIFFCRSRPFQGITFCSIPCVSPPRRKLVPYLAAGATANGLLALTALLLLRLLPWGQPLWACVALLNGILAVSNFAPFQFQIGKARMCSDGLLIVNAFRRRFSTVPAPVQIESVRMLRGLWESIGDHRTLKANLLAMAASWAELGDLERTATALVDAQSLPRIDAPMILASESLVRVAIESGAGKLDEASIALDEAQACFRRSADPLGLLHVALGQAQLAVLRGDISGAIALLDATTQDKRVQRHAAIRIGLLAARLSASLASSDVESVDANLAQYERSRHGQPSRTRDLRVYRAVARFHAQRGDWRKSEPSFRAAVAAIDDLAISWVDPSEQDRFLQAQSGFLAEASDCLHALNKGEEAKRLIEPLQLPANLARRLSLVPAERHRKLFRTAIRVMMFNFLCAAAAIGFIAAVGPRRGEPLPLFAFELVLFTIVAALYLLFHLTIGRMVPALRHSGGAVLLILACLPWLSLIVVPISMLLGP